MPDPCADYSQLVERVGELVDEIKLLGINLSLAHARLRVNDPAFHRAAGDFRELLDKTTESFEDAEILIKRARGSSLADEDQSRIPGELDANLERISEAAEEIVRTVVALKHQQRVKRES